MKHLRNSLFYSVIGILYFFYLSYGILEKFTWTPRLIEDFAHVILISQAIGFSLHFSERRLFSSFKWSKMFYTRFALAIVLNATLGSILLFLYFRFIYLEWNQINWIEWKENNLEIIYKSVLVWLLLSILIQVFQFIFHSFQKLNEEKIAQEKDLAQQMEIQYSLLKRQLSPHFLFNSLNTISSLIYKDESVCEEYIHQFAKLYRDSLKFHHQDLIPLQREINFIESYLFLQKVRFSNSFTYKIELKEESLKGCIPPFSLQILIENIFKHNQLSTENILEFEILENQKEIIVSNKLIPKWNSLQNKNATHKLHGESLQIGLQNIKSRYAFHSKEKVKIEKNSRFTVRLPKLQKHEQ